MFETMFIETAGPRVLDGDALLRESNEKQLFVNKH
jgi:hypothetical protein